VAGGSDARGVQFIEHFELFQDLRKLFPEHLDLFVGEADAGQGCEVFYLRPFKGHA
jgi:hypothetical protein